VGMPVNDKPVKLAKPKTPRAPREPKAPPAPKEAATPKTARAGTDEDGSSRCDHEVASSRLTWAPRFDVCRHCGRAVSEKGGMVLAKKDDDGYPIIKSEKFGPLSARFTRVDAKENDNVLVIKPVLYLSSRWYLFPKMPNPPRAGKLDVKIVPKEEEIVLESATQEAVDLVERDYQAFVDTLTPNPKKKSASRKKPGSEKSPDLVEVLDDDDMNLDNIREVSDHGANSDDDLQSAVDMGEDNENASGNNGTNKPGEEDAFVEATDAGQPEDDGLPRAVTLRPPPPPVRAPTPPVINLEELDTPAVPLKRKRAKPPPKETPSAPLPPVPAPVPVPEPVTLISQSDLGAQPTTNTAFTWEVAQQFCSDFVSLLFENTISSDILADHQGTSVIFYDIVVPLVIKPGESAKQTAASVRFQKFLFAELRAGVKKPNVRAFLRNCLKPSEMQTLNPRLHFRYGFDKERPTLVLESPALAQVSMTPDEHSKLVSSMLEKQGEQPRGWVDALSVRIFVLTDDERREALLDLFHVGDPDSPTRTGGYSSRVGGLVTELAKAALLPGGKVRLANQFAGAALGAFNTYGASPALPTAAASMQAPPNLAPQYVSTFADLPPPAPYGMQPMPYGPPPQYAYGPPPQPYPAPFYPQPYYPRGFTGSAFGRRLHCHRTGAPPVADGRPTTQLAPAHGLVADAVFSRIDAALRTLGARGDKLLRRALSQLTVADTVQAGARHVYLSVHSPAGPTLLHHARSAIKLHVARGRLENRLGPVALAVVTAKEGETAAVRYVRRVFECLADELEALATRAS
jgi:hypothetical protein